jgi:hypothetical protein
MAFVTLWMKRNKGKGNRVLFIYFWRFPNPPQCKFRWAVWIICFDSHWSRVLVSVANSEQRWWTDLCLFVSIPTYPNAIQAIFTLVLKPCWPHQNIIASEAKRKLTGKVIYSNTQQIFYFSLIARCRLAYTRGIRTGVTKRLMVERCTNKRV